MPLQAQIKTDLVQAMKAHDTATVETLRLLQSVLKNEEINSRQELTDEQVLKLIKKEVEKRRESVQFAQQAGRTETVASEQQAITLLDKYLPAELSDGEISAIIDDVLAATPERNFGPLMGQVVSKIGGRASGTRVSALLKQKLG